MKETNLLAAAMTRAAQIAVSELKQKLRDEGKPFHEIRTSDVCGSIARHLELNPRILEKATAEVERWRKKGSLKGARKTPDFTALLSGASDAE